MSSTPTWSRSSPSVGAACSCWPGAKPWPRVAGMSSRCRGPCRSSLSGLRKVRRRATRRANTPRTPHRPGLSSPLADIGGSSELEREERWATLPMLGDYQRLGSLKAGATTLLEAQGSVRVVPGAEPTVIVRGGCRRAAPGRATLRIRPGGGACDGLDLALANAHGARGRPPRPFLAALDPAPGGRSPCHTSAQC